jgi:AraC-like DNA-binding protein
MSFEPTRRGGLLGWSAATGFTSSEVQIAEYALAVLLNEVRSHAPPEWTPNAVHFRHEAPSDLRVHRRVFGPNLRFKSGFNAIEIGSEILNRPLRGGAPGPRAFTQRMLRLKDDSLRSAMKVQVESLLRALLPHTACGIKEVSASLDIPPRTLQARLEDEGTTFRQIKQTVRQDLTKQYLAYSGLSLTEIADLLGYADRTSFSRSYRKWNGRSVRASRHQGR